MVEWAGLTKLVIDVDFIELMEPALEDLPPTMLSG